jgi:hypothetical protein
MPWDLPYIVKHQEIVSNELGDSPRSSYFGSKHHAIDEQFGTPPTAFNFRKLRHCITLSLDGNARSVSILHPTFFGVCVVFEHFTISVPSPGILG